MNLPLALTVSRIAVCPAFVAVYLYPKYLGLGGGVQPVILIIISILMLVTDALDGYLARKWHKVTKLGKLLDPMSDCIVFLSIFFTFTRYPVELPLWIPILIMTREISVVYLRSLMALDQKAMGARLTGKIKTIFQSIALFMILGGMFFFQQGYTNLEIFQGAAAFLMVLVALVSVASLLEYGIASKETLMKSFYSS
ncbi:MAG: CDP-diacylglycerol--glycerol-3-phosphate 3-phosphatidyltransferase [Verrucomicrobia bacterium]|nr:CDP-diacylglycerol--glycerol-3-phosphate 3-phosphatidyltransferase [Verrucomicrobiota bacterium]